jgi:uncharacterized SAM-binding protein YcdF (DUF218 family)
MAMETGELKPVLAALLLPPGGPLLLALAGLLLARARAAAGWMIAMIGIAAALALSTNGVALLLARHLQPPLVAASLDEVRTTQAIVVLGGGVLPLAPEYGTAQPSATTLARLRYGARLARQVSRPMAFAGGVGWAAVGMATESEAAVARRILKEEYGQTPRWIDERSRDTAENARNLAQQLLPQGVRRITLVTDASHMARAASAFRAAGFEVLAAPTGFFGPVSRPLLEWLPSATGAIRCRELLREWVARHAMGAA